MRQRNASFDWWQPHAASAWKLLLKCQQQWRRKVKMGGYISHGGLAPKLHLRIHANDIKFLLDWNETQQHWTLRATKNEENKIMHSPGARPYTDREDKCTVTNRYFTYIAAALYPEFSFFLLPPSLTLPRKLWIFRQISFAKSITLPENQSIVLKHFNPHREKKDIRSGAGEE